MAKNEPIRVPANFGFYGLTEKGRRVLPPYNNLRDDKYAKKFQGALERIYKAPELKSFTIEVPNAPEGYKNVRLMSFKERRYPEDEKKPRLVYKAAFDEEEQMYYLKTGLYIGYLNVGGTKLEINTGYNEKLLDRMLSIAVNNIYLDNSSNNHKEAKNDDNSFSHILGFLFLTSFKAAFAMGLPSEYKTVREQGLNFKGKLDINKYTQRDMHIGDRLTYSYRQREYVQDIIDVLYLAMRVLENTKEFNIQNDYAKYYRQLKQMYSGKRPTRETIRRIEKHRSLNNPMYNRYKKTLEFARLVLEMKDIIHDDDSGKSGVSGFLLDVSQLWEVYLEKLLRLRFENDGYVIKAQEELNRYEDTFYERPNYPDLVIEKDGATVAVIDAKFKTMDFRPKDVDRNDLFQIHSYAGFYSEKNRRDGHENELKFCSLVYPTAMDKPKEKQTDTDLYGIYGLSDAQKRKSPILSIGYLHVKEGASFDEIIKSEEEFLNKIEALLNGEAPKKQADEPNA